MGVDPVSRVAQGIVEGAGGAIGAAAEGISHLYTTDKERLAAANEAAEINQRPQLATIELNKTEAQHPAVFVSGWRPFIGWVCGVALAWALIGKDLFNWTLIVLQIVIGGEKMAAVPALPPTDLVTAMSLISSLLGYGAMRSYDKKNGLSSGQ